MHSLSSNDFIKLIKSKKKLKNNINFNFLNNDFIINKNQDRECRIQELINNMLIIKFGKNDSHENTAKIIYKQLDYLDFTILFKLVV